MAAVQLFATCLCDLALPEVVADAETLLRDAGFDVVFPRGQVCCGQPAHNAGHVAAARRVGRTFARSFAPDLPVVTPSGSCAALLTLQHRGFEIWELSAFLDAHGAAPPARNDGLRVAYHDSCHMLRELGIAAAPRRLLEQTGAELVPLPRPDLCCGFGGTFCIRRPEVSLAMADEKLAGAAGADALVASDPGCLLNLRGRAERTGTQVRVVHLATALARGLA